MEAVGDVEVDPKLRWSSQGCRKANGGDTCKVGVMVVNMV